MGHLTFKDRKRIAELLGLGKNTSYIARVLECHPSTIGREIERGAVYDERTGSRLMRSKRRPLYDPVTAQSNYDTKMANRRKSNQPAGSVTYYPDRKISPWHASVKVIATGEICERFFPSERTAWAYIEEINEVKNNIIYENAR